MTFAQQLKCALKEKNMTQAELAELAEVGRSSISQYVSGAVVPSKKRMKHIAEILEIDDNIPKVSMPTDCYNLSVSDAAKLMGKSVEFVKQGLIDGVFPFGYAVKMKEWSFFISSKKFTEFTGIETEGHHV